MKKRIKYNDDYPTCSRTYVTLCIYSKKDLPSKVSADLKLKLTKIQTKGELVSQKQNRRYPINGWFLSTKDKVESMDFRRHLDWILNKIWKKRSIISTMTKRGYVMNASTYWFSTQGHGGPMVRADQMKKLSDLELEIWFDFYSV